MTNAYVSTMSWSPPSFAALPEVLFQRVDPTPVPAPYPVAWNAPLAQQLGLTTDLNSAEQLERFAGNRVDPDMAPLAAGYAGHQFGSWVPQLGDGRAIVLGELTGRDRLPYEVQLKGAGMTRWSRMGDGRAVLRSTIREYLGSAAMAGLGIPTTRALAIVGSDLPVYRERTESAAILTRVARTHVRFGSFEFLAARQLHEERQTLADYVIERCYPELLPLQASERYGAWYTEIVARTARLMAAWTACGFAHGVMNTDNFSIIGDTIDYGPFGWLDSYDPALICNHSDWAGRYAFSQQPNVGLWNCARLGEALHPLVDEGPARAALDGFVTSYNTELATRFRSKLGLTGEAEEDLELITGLFVLMQTTGADYTRTFRALSRYDAATPGSGDALRAEINDHRGLDSWLGRYASRVTRHDRPAAQRHEQMLAVNPKYVLRNWVAQEVIQNAETRNYALVDQVREVLDRPFDEHPAMERYAEAPPEWAQGIEVSCSS
jgi:uncharacterized protein YdiU (UPF0061 family)